MYNQINKCEQIKEVKQIKNNEYNLNMEILSSIKSIPCKTISLDNNEIINSKDTNKINLGNLSESEPNNTQFTCSTSISRDSVINKNSPYQNYLTPNSIFKPMINQFKVFNYINYFPNFSPTFQFLVNPYNSFSQNYYNFENNYYNFPSLIYNYNQVILNNNNNNISSENNSFLNKKRASDDTSSLSKNKDSKLEINNEQNNIFDISAKKKDLLKINNINETTADQNKQEKIKNYFCRHTGCDIKFKTEKLAIFHHLKMSPKCHEDSINILKLINDTKKLLLKINKEKKTNIDDITSKYESEMKDLSLVEYIKIYTGSKFKDNL